MSMREPMHPSERAHEALFDRIQEEIKQINEHVLEGARRFERIEASTKSAHKRLDDKEQEIKIISKLAYSVQTIAEEMKEMKGEIKEHGKRLLDIEKQPGETAIKYWHVFVVSLITGLGGMIISYLALLPKP